MRARILMPGYHAGTASRQILLAKAQHIGAGSLQPWLCCASTAEIEARAGIFHIGCHAGIAYKQSFRIASRHRILQAWLYFASTAWTKART